ncbi:MAG: HPr family phosphocarrier protein [Aureliella sp.]
MTATAEKTVRVVNPMGIHMRPADLISRAAGQFDSNIEIEKEGTVVDCKSIMSLLTLGARQGSELQLRAQGDDAEQAVSEIAKLFDQGFDESDSELEPESA